MGVCKLFAVCGLEKSTDQGKHGMDYLLLVTRERLRWKVCGAWLDVSDSCQGSRNNLAKPSCEQSDGCDRLIVIGCAIVK